MASVSGGVVTAVEVNGPIANPASNLWDPSSGATWTAIWFVIALIILFVVL